MSRRMRNFVRGGCFGVLAIQCLFAACVLLMMGLGFGLGIKLTEDYTCTMTVIQQHQLVIEELGQPLKPGFLAWTRSYASNQNGVRMDFTSSISGPHGSRQVRANIHRLSVSESYLIEYQNLAGDWVQLYSGSNPCG
jgi:hypothetical protein